MLTEPPTAKVMVDGRADVACNTPCTLSLPAGRHTMTAELNGYNLTRRIFNVPTDSSVLLNLSKSEGVLLVTSTPASCPLLVDGAPAGQTPATLHLAVGSHRIGVASHGIQREATVDVQADGFDVRRFECP